MAAVPSASTPTARGTWLAATLALRRLGAYGIEYVEQPCRTVDEMRELRSLVDVPFAVDETIRTADHPDTIRVREYADVAVLKPAPLGGVAALLRVAEAIDVPVVVQRLAGLLGRPRRRRRGSGRRWTTSRSPAASARARCSRPMSWRRAGCAEGGVISVGRTAPDLAALLAARDRLGEDRAAWWRERLVGRVARRRRRAQRVAGVRCDLTGW